MTAHALVTRAVRAMLKEWTPDTEYWEGTDRLPKAEKINNGECGCFAEALVERLVDTHDLNAFVLDSGDYMRDLCHTKREFCNVDGVHLWTYVHETGLHYDAEAPEGVSDWSQLPFFGRWKRRHKIRRKQTRLLEAQVLECTTYLWLVTRTHLARTRRCVPGPVVRQGCREWAHAHLRRRRERNAV